MVCHAQNIAVRVLCGTATTSRLVFDFTYGPNQFFLNGSCAPAPAPAPATAAAAASAINTAVNTGEIAPGRT